MSLISDVRTIFRYRSLIHQVGQAVSDLEKGQYAQAIHNIKAMIEPPLFAGLAAGALAALDFAQDVLTQLQSCMEKGDALTCFHAVHWHANIAHLSVIFLSSAAVAVKLYFMQPKKTGGTPAA